MNRSVVSYDKDLPEIPDRQAHTRPDAYLRKKPGRADEFEVVDGRRPSKLLLINNLRKTVDQWRGQGYPGASSVTERLFNFWFEEDHQVGNRLFRYYFGQREAVETLVYLIEVAKNRDAKDLIKAFGEVFYSEGEQMTLGLGITHETTMDGRRVMLRYIPEVQRQQQQDLPAENLRRYAFKMATGSGKTYVMAMMMVWAYFHKRLVADSEMSTNFLLLAPNVIVYQRLERDFASNRIFHMLPLIPSEWRSQWQLKVILRGDGSEPDPSGNLFLTNIQQIYESREPDMTAANAVDVLLGRKPVQNLASQGRSLLTRLQGLKDLIAFNDEAHHVHDEDLAWHKTLTTIHKALPNGLAGWLDFSATPKDQNGTYFPWVVCDYPLAQAVEDRIVKAPLIVHQVDRKEPEKITRDGVIDAYREWLLAALERWKEHATTYKPFEQKPVLFIMAEQNNFADEIGKWLVDEPDTGLKANEVLVIHTDRDGEVSKKDLEAAREAARDVDKPDNPIKVIVSVLMLREGWDVKNVTIVLGLRPFTSKARILPEQAVGRGLRLIEGIGPDRTQTLEVMGTQAFEEFVKELETEGVGIKTVVKAPLPPVRIEPVQRKVDKDITIPLTRPVYTRNYKRLKDLDAMTLDPIYDQEELDEPFRIRLQMEFATTETEVHQADIGAGEAPLAQDLLGKITNKVIVAAKLSGEFSQLYPIVRTYVVHRCFGRKIDLENEDLRHRLNSAFLQDGIAGYLARKIGELTAEMRTLEMENAGFKLSATKPFTWRRNLPLLSGKKTIFNLVATYNDYEKSFARFLEGRKDVVRFAALGTTEQESGTTFRVDYLKPNGAIGFYYPDWVMVQKTAQAEVNWIVETKGRVWEGTEAKDEAMDDWCRKISVQTGSQWRYLRVNQTTFGAGDFASFQSLVDRIEEEGF